MSPVQRRVKNVIARAGEAFSVGASSRKGIFAFLAPGAANTYVDPGIVAALPRPIRVAYVGFDDVTAESDTVSYAAASLTVYRALDLRHRGEVVARMLVLA